MTRYTSEDINKEDFKRGYADGLKTSLPITLSLLRTLPNSDYDAGFVLALIENKGPAIEGQYKNIVCRENLLDGVAMAIKDEEFKSNYPSGEADKAAFDYTKALMKKVDWSITSDDGITEIRGDSYYGRGLSEAHLINMTDKYVVRDLLKRAANKDRHALGLLLAHHSENNSNSFIKGATDRLLGNKVDYGFVNNAWRGKYDSGYSYIDRLITEMGTITKLGYKTVQDLLVMSQSDGFRDGYNSEKIDKETIQRAISNVRTNLDSRSIGFLAKVSGLTTSESYIKGFVDRILEKDNNSEWADASRYVNGYTRAGNFLEGLPNQYKIIDRKKLLDRQLGLKAGDNYIATEYYDKFLERGKIEKDASEERIYRKFMEGIYNFYYDSNATTLKSNIDGKVMDQTDGLGWLYRYERIKFFMVDYERGYNGLTALYGFGYEAGRRDRALGLAKAKTTDDFSDYRIRQRIVENCPNSILDKQKFSDSTFVTELMDSYGSNLKELEIIGMQYFNPDKEVLDKDAQKVIKDKMNIYEAYGKILKGEIIAKEEVIIKKMSGKTHVIQFIDGFTDRVVFDKCSQSEEFYKAGNDRAINGKSSVRMSEEIYKHVARITVSKLDKLPDNDIFLSFMAGVCHNHVNGNKVAESGFDSTYFNKGKALQNWDLLGQFMNHYMVDRKQKDKRVDWIEKQFSKWISALEKEEKKEKVTAPAAKGDDKGQPEGRLDKWKGSLKPGAVDGLLRFMKVKFISKLSDSLVSKKPKREQKKYMEIAKDILESPLGDLVFFSIISEATSPIGERVGLPEEYRDLISAIARQKVVGEVTYQVLDITSEGLGIGYDFLKEYFKEIKDNKEVMGFIAGDGRGKGDDLFGSEPKKQREPVEA